jgi:tetracycline 7-halogenase / FADH2 O2-dependent halogenase
MRGVRRRVNHRACDVAIVGSGFAGSLLARVLAVQGYDVVLLERGTHPRFAIGESTTPLANLSLERLAARYGLADCYELAAHGRWLARNAHLRRGLKRGFSFYRHHPGEPFADRGFESERLLVAASPHDGVADTHWLRADVDHHFVREAVAAGVDFRDRAELTHAEIGEDGAALSGSWRGEPFALRARFVVDASGPSGFLARQLAIPSALQRTSTHSALLFGHFGGVRTLSELLPGLPDGPYPDDWAAVHHLIDEGWMYSLRFDDGVTSAGFLLTARGAASLGAEVGREASVWSGLLERYPTIGAAFGAARETVPLRYVPRVQHRLAHGVGERWALLPHAFAFVDPLYSTGIAWSLRAVERLGLAFEEMAAKDRVPSREGLARYGALMAAEADQIDRLVAGAYAAMGHFELFAAHAMLYFATVSFAEVEQRVAPGADTAWRGFLGVGDPVLEPLPGEALARLLRPGSGSDGERARFARWVSESIAPRNVAGLADPARSNLYPVDLDVLVERHALLGMTRARMLESLPALRGLSPEPTFAPRVAPSPATSSHA